MSDAALLTMLALYVSVTLAAPSVSIAIELPVCEKLKMMLFSSTAKMFEILLEIALTVILETVLLGVISSVTFAKPSLEISMVRLFPATCEKDWGNCSKVKKIIAQINGYRVMLSLVSKGLQLVAACSLS